MAVSGSARTRVLVIDDDQDLGALLARYLRGFDFEVSIARDATDGLQALERDPPDIVILDVMLPEMDGFTVCRKVRERSRVPIVMLTARGAVDDRVVGLELGADDYVSKPFEPRELMARMQAVLRRSAAIEGRVVDESGDPVPGVRVTAESRTGSPTTMVKGAECPRYKAVA